GLVRYDISNKRNFSAPFQAQIRKVNCGKDSIIYNGNVNIEEKNIPQLNYNLNSMYFEYAGLFFEDGTKNMYSYKLEGQDTAWSNWSLETKAVFTNLREGEYTFFIKSKNIYGTESNTASYSFSINTPWYRTWIMYVVYVIFLTLIIYLFIKSRTKKLILEKEQLEKIVSERTAEVVEQKILIEEKHKEITDSINYAERIQRSFLATKKLLDENLKDYFVFFQPKDIVIGDFYWGSKLADGNFALVTADSTGHGVPGAIMSILNISSLEKAIEKNLVAPAEILNDTRKTIIERLKKDGSIDGGNDGMDCSLISFKFLNHNETEQNLLLNYSAANNPVWIIRNSTDAISENLKEIIELKPDKMPVGKSDNNQKSFTQNQFQLQKGDVIYTLTDGFPDQFGGEKGKKFMNKQLKEFLISIAHLSMEVQKNEVSRKFNNWKGELEQVDDVCIIGIKI
ncbi:MAG: SpoIIE family protein phosphatase, partial [Ferruginibacter sp.]